MRANSVFVNAPHRNPCVSLLYSLCIFTYNCLHVHSFPATVSPQDRAASVPQGDPGVADAAQLRPEYERYIVSMVS